MMEKFINLIYRESPLQKKKLMPFLESRPPAYWQRANTFARQFEAYLTLAGLNIEYAVDAYLKMCKDMLTEQTKFLRSGVYSRANQQDAFENVYTNDAEMRSYMVGLALSQYLWETHYAMYDFFLDTITSLRGEPNRYLEIGPGHGLFLAAALNELEAGSYKVVDISPVSLDVCRGFLKFLVTSKAQPELCLANAFDIESAEQFDFITMGEVIEHLDDPRPMLKKIARLLKPNGHAFLTTCANCPAIDHVYLFRNIGEIRSLIQECGLTINDERVLPVEKLGVEELERHRVCINYAAVVCSG